MRSQHMREYKSPRSPPGIRQLTHNSCLRCTLCNSKNTMKVILLLCLVGVALSAPQLRTQQQEEEDTPEPYHFSLAVADEELGNHQQRVEEQDANGVVQGEYSWVDANGVRHLTTYSADPVNGFQSNTIQEQTDIRVVIPQPTPGP
ncbi:larval cuticle protein A2B-like [Penaeus japonicus]|uniref:larval cuticle protein A2B-like n=1 Tax=Penaeus japonicus TaxID=27405 RepID=UPI001C70CF74|nr:larval cuticle protein A2B-like [Penaeus japonicus]